MLPMRPCSYPTLLHDPPPAFTPPPPLPPATTSISSIPLPRPPPRPPRHLHYLVAVLLAVLAVLAVLVVSASTTIISPNKQRPRMHHNSGQFPDKGSTAQTSQPIPQQTKKTSPRSVPLRKTSQSRRTMARQFPKDFLELVLIGGSKDFLCC